MQKTRKRGRLAARISLVVTAIAIAMVYLVGTIHQFVGDAPQFDDTTMLCIKLKRTAEEGPRETES